MLASNEALGIFLIAALIALGWRNRPFLRDIWRDGDRFWRIVVRLAAATTGLLALWITLLDRWRQLSGAPYRGLQVWESDRVVLDPPADGVRTITLVLLVASTVLVAALFSRHVGGIGTALLVLVVVGALWVPVFILRSRFNIDLAMGFGGSWTSPLDVAAHLGFVFAAWATEATLILAMYAFLVALAAIPLTIVLGPLGLRESRVKPTTSAWYNALGDKRQE